MNLFSEPILALVGTAIGWAFRQFAETRKANRDFQMLALQATTQSMDAAAQRANSKFGEMMQQSIFLLVAVMFLSVIVAGYVNVPVIVEAVQSKGILFWRRDVTEFVSLQGVLFPQEVRQAFIIILTFYFGQAVK
jgi:hypothetical protein